MLFWTMWKIHTDAHILTESLDEKLRLGASIIP